MYRTRQYTILATLMTSATMTSSWAVSTVSLSNGVDQAGLVTELIDTSASNITYSNIRYRGANLAGGIFTGGMADGIGIERGVILSSGNISNAIGPNRCYKTTSINRQAGDSNLTSLIGADTYDATVLEFDFVPSGDKIQFNYVFASEEYNEFVGTPYNDVFGFFLDGKNIALVPNAGVPVAINTVNSLSSYATYYRNNAYRTPNNWNDYFSKDCVAGYSTPYPTEFDGFTTVLTAIANVTPGKTHHIKLAVADTSDYSLDSAVFIQGKSFMSPPPPPPPPAATQLTPNSLSGTVCNRKPTYAWSPEPTSTQYRLLVNMANQTIVDRWYSASEVGCAQGTNQCTKVSDTELPLGFGQWWVQAANSSGTGPLSNPLSFTIETSPMSTVPITPVGKLNSNLPTYTWNAVFNANKYHVLIKNMSGQVISDQWYTPTEANCPGGFEMCSVSLTTPLPDGDYQWWLQASNDCGQSNWSEGFNFTLNTAPPPPPPVTRCQLFAVDDQTLNDSQFFTIDQQDKVTANLGLLHLGLDIESLAAHPLTKELYVAAGDEAVSQPGALYRVNTNTGELVAMGNLQFSDGQPVSGITGLSFNPNTNILWGWATGKGLFRVSENNPLQAELRWHSTQDIGDLNWNKEGTALYLIQRDTILRYDGSDIQQLCILPQGERAESLETTADNQLLFVMENSDNIQAIDIATLGNKAICEVKSSGLPPTNHTDIEGMALICTTK